MIQTVLSAAQFRTAVQRRYKLGNSSEKQTESLGQGPVLPGSAKQNHSAQYVLNGISSLTDFVENLKEIMTLEKK